MAHGATQTNFPAPDNATALSVIVRAGDASCDGVREIVEETLSRLGSDIHAVFFDAATCEELLDTYQIRCLPCLLLFESGELISQHVGTLEQGDLERMLGAIVAFGS